mmetsp:Transcript_843/g.2189  ORF Transcript_843/g.2189 Transcript_843/m.2189 type:complete len:220 (-) Transcript_843:428-1087(-)
MVDGPAFVKSRSEARIHSAKSLRKPRMRACRRPLTWLPFSRWPRRERSSLFRPHTTTSCVSVDIASSLWTAHAYWSMLPVPSPPPMRSSTGQSKHRPSSSRTRRRSRRAATLNCAETSKALACRSCASLRPCCLARRASFSSGTIARVTPGWNHRLEPVSVSVTTVTNGVQGCTSCSTLLSTSSGWQGGRPALLSILIGTCCIIGCTDTITSGSRSNIS